MLKLDPVAQETPASKDNLDSTVIKELISKQILLIKEYSSLDSVLEDITNYLRKQDDINENVSLGDWTSIFSFVESNINQINRDILSSYFGTLFNLKVQKNLEKIDGKMCHKYIIKQYQMLLYSDLNNSRNDGSISVYKMFDVSTELFKSFSNIDTGDPDNTDKLLFLLDVFKSLISLIISTYEYVINSPNKIIIKHFYKIWNCVDKLLINLNSKLESSQKKNIIISLEYLINKFFNNLVEIDKELYQMDNTLEVFMDLLEDEKDNSINKLFYLKLIDNYLLFNIGNMTRVLLLKVENGIENTKFYLLFDHLFKEINRESIPNEYCQLLSQIVINYLQTTISNMNNHSEDEGNSAVKADLRIQQTIKFILIILKLNDFQVNQESEKFYKILLTIINDYGYIINDHSTWDNILELISNNMVSKHTNLLLKTIVSNDDILNNLNLTNIEATIDLINKVILDNIKNQNELATDDNLLLNYFNYYWNINDYLSNFEKEKLKVNTSDKNELQHYYDTWTHLLNNLFFIFQEIGEDFDQTNLKVSVLTLYFNLINTSLAIVNEQQYSDLIQKIMIDDKLLKNKTIILNSLCKNDEVLDIIFKELLILVNINHKPYFEFFKNVINLGNENGNNNVLYVLLTNYYKVLERSLKEGNLNKELKEDLYQIWLSYDFSFNNDTIINEIKDNSTTNKSQYNLITEYMKIYPLVNELLSTEQETHHEHIETDLRIIDKCLKFPILPNNSSNDENNMTILQRYCVDNIKIMLNTTHSLIVLEKLSDIIHYKSVIKDLIYQKIFNKLPDRLSHRLPTFKRLSYEALLLLGDYCKKRKIFSDVIIQNLLKTINSKDITKTTVKNSSPMWVLSSQAIICLLDLTIYSNKKIFLIIFNTILEDNEQVEETIIELYKHYSVIFYENIRSLKTVAKEFDILCANVVGITSKKELLPIYNIFSARILAGEEFELKTFDSENLWLLISNLDDGKNNGVQFKTLENLIFKDLQSNINQIKDITNGINTFLNLINLNYELNSKYYR